MQEQGAQARKKTFNQMNAFERVEAWWKMWRRTLEIRDANNGVWPDGEHEEVGGFIHYLRDTVKNRRHTLGTDQHLAVRKEKFEHSPGRALNNKGSTGGKLDDQIARAGKGELTTSEINNLRSRRTHGQLSDDAVVRLRAAGVDID